MKPFRKKRRSLVRILASCVPSFVWKFVHPIPLRMFISAQVMEKIIELKENNLPIQQQADLESFCNFKNYFNNKNEPYTLYSTPKRDDVQNHKISELQKELDEIKKQVARLMEHHSEQIRHSGYGTLSSMQMQSVIPPPPPPPLPPPPPPLPSSNANLPVITPLKSNCQNKHILPIVKKGFPFGPELLKDLKKVQLRKVEKSPGGGPLKKPKNIDDPGDFLEAILKKRFGLMQNSPESSLESVSTEENSFNFGGTFKYKEDRNLKVAVT